MKFEEARTRATGCPICGEPNKGRVGVQVQELDRGKAGKSVMSRSYSFCEQHTIDVGKAMQAALDLRAGRAMP